MSPFPFKITIDFSQIISKVFKNHKRLIKKALRNVNKAVLVIGLPSLPGSFQGATRVPGLALRLGRLKVEFAASNIGTGGSLIGFGLKYGPRRAQLFRIDYHGTGSPEEPDAEYFHAGPPILGESKPPIFHYHTPRQRGNPA